MHGTLTGTSLAIASGHDLSLAVLVDEMVQAERNVLLERGHSERLMPELRALLAPLGGAAYRPAQIVVEIGPGSFTGLRIGLAAAHGLGLAWGCKVLGVRSTLLVAAAARAGGKTGRLLVALAAPRGQLWLEAFDLSTLHSLGAPEAVLPEAAMVRARAYANVAGSGSAAAKGGVAGPGGGPRAASVALISAALLEAPVPLYVRPGEALAAA